MNNIIEKTKILTERYSIDILIESMKYSEDEFYIDMDNFNLLSDNEKKECLELATLFFAIVIWSNENNKSADRVFRPKILGGDFELNDFETRYIFLKIISIPFERDNLLDKHYEVLKTISKSIFVQIPDKINNIVDYMTNKRAEKFN